MLISIPVHHCMPSSYTGDLPQEPLQNQLKLFLSSANVQLYLNDGLPNAMSEELR